MNEHSGFSRRSFLRSSVLGTTAVGILAHLPSTVTAEVVKPAREPFGGLKMGIASYSLRKFSLDEAIAMTKQAGVRYITLKDMHLPMKSTREQRQEARRKIEAAGLTLMGGGVIYMKNKPEEIRAAFEYAKDAGMPTIVCSPDLDALDTVEAMVKEYDLRVAIHNHGPGDNKYPSPLDVMKMVEKRDSRMGICMDVGHTVRINQDPVKVMKACAKRLYDYHVKDVTAANEKGGGIECGMGVIDLPGVLGFLLKIKYPYHVALEYEIKENAPLPGIIESLAYMRGVIDGIQG